MNATAPSCQATAKQGTKLPPQDELRKQILERMVNDQVKCRKPRKPASRSTTPRWKNPRKRIADENNVSMTEFRRLLETDGVKYNKFREEIRGELIMQRLREREVEGNVNVTEAEVDTQLALESKESTSDQEYRLRTSCFCPEQATAVQIEAKRARPQALAELRKGADFADFRAVLRCARRVARRQSGLASGGRLPAIFTEALSTLKQGEITDILKSPNGFHIVKLLDKRGRDAAPSITKRGRATS